MKPILRSLMSPDLFDMENQAPEIANDFQILVQALIGPENLPGQESFDFLVCTPSVIHRTVTKLGYLIPRHYIIIERYDYDAIWSIIKSICDPVFGNTWHDVALKLSRYGMWEFEDYQK